MSTPKTSHCNNNRFPPSVKGSAPGELSNLKMLNIPVTWLSLIYPYFLLIQSRSNSLFNLVVIHSVGTLTCDDSSTQYFLAIPVLVTGTLSFSGVAQLWNAVSKGNRLACVLKLIKKYLIELGN